MKKDKGDLSKQHKQAAAKTTAAKPAEVKVDAKPAAYLTSLSRGRTIDRGQF